MKKITISKLLAVFLISIVLLSGCNSKGSQTTGDKKAITIGISQLAEHPALDEARRGFEDGLKELGIEADIEYQNAQGDIPTSLSIAQKFVKDGVDLIFAIATPAAEAAAGIGSDIPILFSAVTDPVAAHLVESNEKPGGMVTGTSDKNDVKSQMETFKKIYRTIEKIGIIYSADG